MPQFMRMLAAWCFGLPLGMAVVITALYLAHTKTDGGRGGL